MISNITNALPILLKRLKDKNDDIPLKFDLVEMLNFYDSILPRTKTSYGLKHIYLDCVFKLNEKYVDLLKTFQISIDTLPFLKDFEYSINEDEGFLVIRSSCEELSIFSMIILGSIKNLPKDVNNKGIFVSLAFHYLQFCHESGYKICSIDDVSILEKYNEGFDDEVFEAISFVPTQERHIGTIHFVGVELNKDILCIFEKYKNVSFTYNEENASFIISMKANDWDDFWKNAPKYLKDEFNSENERKVNVM